MCIYVGSDVVLANLLCYSPQAENGLNYSDMETYCRQVKDRLLAEKKEGYISFQLSDFQLDNSIREYPRYFSRFAGRYYRGTYFQIEPFKKRVTADIADIMCAVARES